MRVSLVPALEAQRRLCDTPPGMGRFREYLQEMLGGTHDIRLPIGEFNPMGQEHMAKAIDGWIRIGAERLVALHAKKAALRLATVHDEIRVATVVIDDVGGPSSDRDRVEARFCFQDQSRIERGFATVNLWTGEAPSPTVLATRTAASLYRTVFQRRYGLPTTLAERMRQEGLVARFIRDDRVATDAEMALVRAHEHEDDFATSYALFYGDDAARKQGFKPLGATAGAARRVARRLAGDPVAALHV